MVVRDEVVVSKEDPAVKITETRMREIIKGELIKGFPDMVKEITNIMVDDMRKRGVH